MSEPLEQEFSLPPEFEPVIFGQPKYEWEWTFNGNWDCLTIRCMEAPNWFHRLMQRFLVNIHWRKIEEPEQ